MGPKAGQKSRRLPEASAKLENLTININFAIRARRFVFGGAGSGTGTRPKLKPRPKAKPRPRPKARPKPSPSPSGNPSRPSRNLNQPRRLREAGENRWRGYKSNEIDPGRPDELRAAGGEDAGRRRGAITWEPAARAGLPPKRRPAAPEESYLILALLWPAGRVVVCQACGGAPASEGVRAKKFI